MGFLNLLSISCFVIIVFYIRFLLSKSVSTQYKVLKIQLFLVLVYNIVIHIVVPSKIPVELSTVAYFVVPVILYFNIKKGTIWAVYSALISGFFYYVSMIIAGQAMYGHFPVYSYLTSLFNHGTLLVYSIIVLTNVAFHKREKKVIYIGLVLSSLYALLIKPIITHPGRIFIYEILEAQLVKTYFIEYKYISYPIYYILLLLFLYLTAHSIIILSKKLYKSKKYDKIKN